MNYIPLTEGDVKEILSSLNTASVEDLFNEIPKIKRISSVPELPEPLFELSLLKELKTLASKNKIFASFLGAGVYNHYIPPVVKALVNRSEIYTAYTPYQPEISQGVLQIIYEYQSLICKLLGMEVSNASLYDGATALVEAAFLSCRVTKKNKILVSKAVSPLSRAVLKTYAKAANIKILELPFSENGQTDFSSISRLDKCACLIVQQPNFFGVIEDLENVRELCNKNGALFVLAADPLSLAVLKSPGELGVDVAVCEGQSFGNPQNYGGPLLGVIATKKKYVRELPGRIAGKTTDAEGKTAFCLTLQTREQHIRRERATSNICSNEALCAVATCIYLAYLGKKGPKDLANLCLQKANYLKEKLSPLLSTKNSTFREFVVRLKKKPNAVFKKLLKKGILCGLPLGRFYPKLKDCLLVSVGEHLDKEVLDLFVSLLQNA